MDAAHQPSNEACKAKAVPKRSRHLNDQLAPADLEPIAEEPDVQNEAEEPADVPHGPPQAWCF